MQWVISSVKRAVKKILVLRNDRFGEFLLNIPALRALKETFPQAEITAVIDPALHELAQLVPFIAETISWPQHAHALREKIRLVNFLRKSGFDLAIMLNPSQEFNLYCFLAGIPRRIGYDRKWGFLLTDKIEDLKHLGKKHEVEYNLELAGLAGAKTQDLRLSLPVDDAIINNCFFERYFAAHDRVIAVHPWTSDERKKWPLGYFQQLVLRLAEDRGLKIAIIGSKEFSGQAQAFFKISSGNIVNLTGKTSLKELAVLLKRCRLLVSADSGPVHLAACVGTPVIALFRNDLLGKTAQRWGPWGSGHRVLEKPVLSEISVEEVLRQVREVLR